MKTRIGLIVAVIAGLTATGLNVFLVGEKITRLQAEIEKQSNSRLMVEAELVQKKGDFATVVTALQQSTADLEQVKAEKESATAEVFALNQNLAALRRQHEEAQTELARYNARITAEDAASLAKQIKTLREALDATRAENKILRTEVELTTRVGCRWPREGNVTLPAELEGRVLAFDAKWNFVVLDAGEEQGIVEGGEMLVNRNGKLVAKVIVRRVERNRCIANVVKEWSFSEIMEGDAVIAAHPSS